MTRLRPGTVRSEALRISALNLLKDSSIGLRSGEYLGEVLNLLGIRRGASFA